MNDISGILLEPKRFAIHDGPGIRTTFFFKGCVLKCFWCHNPESISPHPQLGYFDSKCVSCEDCATVCPVNAHTFGDRHRIDRNACTLCGKCTFVCPGGALKIYGQVMTVEEAVKIALADRTFYQESGGGVTLSGGEPLLQLAFAGALLKALKKENLHTALDSCACVSTSAFEQIFPYTDMFLIDFKHALSAEHRRLTGMGNELVLQNLQYLSDRGGRIEIRIPVVPGCNDSLENMQKTAEILAKIRPESVRLLPYHSLAGGKYRAVDMPDTMPQVPSPGREQLAVFTGVLQKSGLTVRF